MLIFIFVLKFFFGFVYFVIRRLVIVKLNNIVRVVRKEVVFIFLVFMFCSKRGSSRVVKVVIFI